MALLIKRSAPAPAVLIVGLCFQALTVSAHTTRSASTNGAPLESVAYHRRCPANGRAQASPEMATARVLVPAHPTGALICRYWGPNDRGHRPGSLAGALHVENANAVDRLAVRLDALPPAPSHPSCPAFGGRSDLIFFHYRGAGDDPVRIVREGCVPVSNGRLVRSGLGLPYGHWPDTGLL
jgi:hypothetical protein